MSPLCAKIQTPFWSLTIKKKIQMYSEGGLSGSDQHQRSTNEGCQRHTSLLGRTTATGGLVFLTLKCLIRDFFVFLSLFGPYLGGMFD